LFTKQIFFTGFFKDEKVIFPLSTSTDTGFKLFRFKIGQLCLVDETPSTATESNQAKNLISSKESTACSILVIDQDLIDADTSTATTDGAQAVNAMQAVKSMFRGVVIDESLEKCVVQNLDSGKKLSLKKKRIHPLSQASSEGTVATPTGGSRSKLNAVRLVQIIPFMLIKAKPFEEITSQSVKRVLKNSIYYSEEILLNIGGNLKIDLYIFEVVLLSEAIFEACFFACFYNIMSL